MNEPATPAGKRQLEQLIKQIKISELGGSSEQIIFAVLSKKMLDLYRADRENIVLGLGEEEDGLVRILLRRKQES